MKQLRSVRRAARLLARTEAAIDEAGHELSTVHVQFPEKPEGVLTLTQHISRIASEVRLAIATGRELAALVDKALPGGGFISKTELVATKAEFIRTTLISIYAIRAEHPTDPLSPGHELRRQLMAAYRRGIPLEPKAWAYASIATDFEKPCLDADEFWNRVSNVWKRELARAVNQLKPYGLVVKNHRARMSQKTILGARDRKTRRAPRNR